MLAFGAVRSCGVTTLVLSLAGTWPEGRRVLLAELDPAGGTLAAASGWTPEPGLVSLAAAARRGGDADLVWEHCQRLPGGAAVLAGPASADQAHNALAMVSGFMGRLGELDADVLVDCGRLDRAASSFAALGAELIVLAARPRLTDLHTLATWIEENPLDGSDVGLVLVGDGPYSDDEVTDAFGLNVLGRVPWDPAGAAALVSVPSSARSLRVAPLVRAGRSLAERIGAEFVPAIAKESDHASVAERPLVRRLLRARGPRTRALTVGPDSKPASNGSAPEAVSQ